MPSGAIPKDGPSAGVTMVTALASELTGRPVRGDIAMTGEITLSGRVLPVGGIKEKVLAARRHGITEVILPRQNEKNIKEDLTDELRRELTIHYVVHIEEVLALALCRRQRRRTPAVASPGLLDAMTRSVRANGPSSNSPSPTTVFMSTISPRRIIVARFGERERARFDVLVLVDCPPARFGVDSPDKPEEDHLLVAVARRRQRSAPSRTIVSGTWPISSWHSRAAAASGSSPGSTLPAGSSHSHRLTA